MLVRIVLVAQAPSRLDSFPKNHTASPREGSFWADTHAVG
jgi:hypothetical protein